MTMSCCNSGNKAETRTSGNVAVESAGNACECAPAGGAVERPSFAPAFDVVRGPEGFTLLADVPGCKPGDIELTAEGGVLTIVGHVAPRGGDAETAGASVLRREYAVGDYRVALGLPSEVDASRITASLTDGVLRVSLPNRPEQSRRQIAVTN